MTTIKRFTPDYKMHAVRFEAFAREAEHGEYVKFDAHQRAVSALEAERNALAVENAAMREALDSIRIYSSDALSGPSDSVPDMAAWLREGVEHLHQVSTIETPATSAALASIEARGVEKFADRMLTLANDPTYSTASHRNDLRDAGAKAMNYAAAIREAK